jgi:predicted membrane protein
MSTRWSSWFSSQAVVGLVLMVIGVAFFLDNLEVVRARDILRYWPLVLVMFGLVKMVEPGPTGARLFGLVFSVIGLLLLLDNLNVIYFHFWDLWPLVLVLLGISMIWRVLGGGGNDSGSDDSFVRGTAFMGGGKRTTATRDLRGGDLSAVMGGIELDLRGAQMQGQEATISLFTFWGGIEVKVPREWNVDVRVTPLLGGVEDKTHHSADAGAKRLVLKGTAVMGGVEVKN